MVTGWFFFMHVWPSQAILRTFTSQLFQPFALNHFHNLAVQPILNLILGLESEYR